MALFVAACGDKGGDTTTEEAKKPAMEEKKGGLTDGTYALTADNKLMWEGKKVAYGHNGTIDVTKGEFTVAKGMISGGSFEIDMNTIANTDIEAAEDNAKLVGHLKAADFFDAGQFPTAMFKITSVAPGEGTHKITGDLTLKGKTNPVTFDATVTEDGGTITTKAAFEIDRSKWGIEFNSKSFSAFENLAAENIINDEIGIQFELKAAKAAM